MHAVDCLLESFCSTRTSLNTHASRLVLITELEFNLDGGLEGGGLEIALPDTSRLLRTGRKHIQRLIYLQTLGRFKSHGNLRTSLILSLVLNGCLSYINYKLSENIIVLYDCGES